MELKKEKKNTKNTKTKIRKNCEIMHIKYYYTKLSYKII